MFSDTLKNMHWCDCNLCGKSVIMLEKEQTEDDSLLCKDCVNNELRMESMIYD